MYSRTPDELKGFNRARGGTRHFTKEEESAFYKEHMARFKKSAKAKDAQLQSVDRYMELASISTYIPYTSPMPRRSHSPYKRFVLAQLTLENFSFAHFEQIEHILALLFQWITNSILKPLKGDGASVEFVSMADDDCSMVKLECPDKNGCSVAPAKRRLIVIRLFGVDVNDLLHNILKHENFYVLCDRHGLRCCWDGNVDITHAEHERDSEERTTAEAEAYSVRNNAAQMIDYCNAIRGHKSQRYRHRATQGLPCTSLRFAAPK